jgi:probable phosphoglycerate mutase
MCTPVQVDRAATFPAVPGTVRLLLVRHGESTWNAEGRWQGHADPPLSERGRSQARSAAGAIPADVGIIAASDLGRARETAELLADGAGLGAVWVDDGFRERDAGLFSGLTRAEIHARYPGALPDDPVRSDRDRHRGVIEPEGWEPDASVTARAWAGMGRLADAMTPRDVSAAVVVTHSGLIYAVERELGVVQVRIANLEGRWIARDDGRWAPGERQLLLDPAHDVVTHPGTP